MQYGGNNNGFGNMMMIGNGNVNGNVNGNNNVIGGARGSFSNGTAN